MTGRTQVRADPSAQQAIRHVWHHATQVADYADTGPIMLVEGDGVFVRDTAGREYIDGTSILGVTQIGHGRPEMADAIGAQVRSIEYASLANGFSNVPAAKLAARLAEITPGDLSVSYFVSSGSEATEAAIKMARQCQRNRGFPAKWKVIARRGSYHGATIGALSASGLPALRTPFEPLAPGFRHISQPYVYRCEWGCPAPECGERAARALEAAILFEGAETVAAFIAEPIAVPQAIKVPPPNYWPLIQEICHRYDVLLIVDEVFVGFGRTGTMFASEQFGLLPDILTVSKGLTSGYIPLGAAIATRAVFESFWGERSSAFAHAGTFSGHPVACAAAIKNLEIIEREQLATRAVEMGARLGEGLRSLAEHPFVGDVSGIGLLWSVELVEDRVSKEPARREIFEFVRDRMADAGILIRYLYDAVFLYPPLIIEADQIDRIVDALDEVLREAGERFRRPS